jgi:hypothetical protein
MTRWKAASIHLGICAIVAVVLAVAVWFVWYPPPLFVAVGGLEIFLILLAVDVVLGPLITLIVFKQGKKSLKFDLSVIALVQACALGYGIFTLWEGRPVYVAALGHRFDVVQASEITESTKSKMSDGLPMFGPKTVGIRPPKDKSERERVFWTAVTGGGDYGHLPAYHAPIETMADELKLTAKPIDELKRLNPGKESEIELWLVSKKLESKNARFLGVKARTSDITAFIDVRTGSLVGLAAFKPWP